MARKSLKESLKKSLSPAAAFISAAEPREPEAKKIEKKAAKKEAPIQADIAGIIPEGMRLVQESKSRRVHLLMRPTAYGWLEAKANREGVSVNEEINLVIEAAKKNEEGK